MRIMRAMTDDDHADRTIPLTVRMPVPLMEWLKRKQAEHLREGLDVSLSTLVKQLVARAKTTEEVRPHGPKKARPST
jgi:hypothetical protein